MMRGFPERYLLPFNSAGWFRAYVINHAGDTTNLVHDAGGNTLQNLPGEAHPVGSHGIVGFDDADSHSEAVSTVVTHDSHAANGEKYGKGLPNFTIESGATYLLDNYGVGFLQGVEMFTSDLAEKPYCQSWTGKRVFQKNLVRKPEVFAYPADLILEKVSEGFDEGKRHVFG